MILDTLPNAARYASLHPFFPEAFRFLQQTGLASLPDGRHDLLDNNRLYALVQSYDTNPLEGGLLEGHENYIDIQFILRGRESIGWAPFESQPVAEPYDPGRDIAFFHGPCQLIKLRANDFAILWPSDLHLPMRHFAGIAEPVRKIVLKIKASS
jgi:YhcH/YjgK/YiaL family protein